METSELKNRVIESFKVESRPHQNQIAPHRCAECDELADDLKDQDPLDFPAERLGYHCWDLPLLSSQAKRFFLPAWILRSIDEPASDFTDALIMNLDSDHRQEGYTEPQKAAILDYLRYIRDIEAGLDRQAIRSAEERWKHDA